MDRPLDPEFQRRRRIKRISLGGISLVVIVVAVVLMPGWIRPTLHRDRIRIATVEAGPVEETVSASGTIVPEREQVISSPMEARVIEILKQPGARVTPQDAIVRLDVGQARLALDKLSDELALKVNRQKQAGISLENELIDLKSRIESRRLELKALEFKLAQNKTLFERGLVSVNDLRQVETETAQAKIEIDQLEASRKNKQRLFDVQMEGLALETAMLRKDRTESQRRLDLAATRPDRAGVLTWVTPEVGATIRAGETIARVADLSSYRVEADVPDMHAARLAPGQPARVRLDDDTYLEATVARVRPAVTNGTIKVDLTLADARNAKLRTNMKVDAFIVAARRPRALRIRRGPGVEGSQQANVFVLRGDAAVRVPVRLGIIGFDYVEVEHGLVAGDQVIISDMTNFQHLRELSVLTH